MSIDNTTVAQNFSDRHVVIVGAGITGLAAAHHLLQQPHPPRVTIVEGADRIGGIIQASPFAGLDSVDESADAFLTRTPSAMKLCAAVGLDNHLTSPAANHAYIWNNKMHAIPAGTVLGVPGSHKAIWNTKQLTTSGKLRASVEPLLPRALGRSTDSLGAAIRSRCGNEVLERLVDPLVGSIYAADTDNFSVQGMPQVAELLAQPTSLMRAARNAMQKRTNGGPVFATPMSGMSTLTRAVYDRIVEAGTRVILSSPVRSIEPQGQSYVVHLETESLQADAVILASPARHTAALVKQISSETSMQLQKFEHASVIMIALTISRSQWPQHLTGTGYLVPKPVQTGVTAVSFGSNKWAHWKTASDEMILRVSLGRDGAPMHHLDDKALLEVALRDLRLHLGFDATPTNMRFTRWIESFPQYRPGHAGRVDALDKQLHESAPGIVLAGASYRGIGIPACINDGQRAATRTLNELI
jgi:oxygen-dependent protoporphyrinogen oxidase